MGKVPGELCHGSPQLKHHSSPDRQIPLLADGIQIHGEKSTEQLKPLHNRLVTCFQELKEKVEKHYGVITLIPLLADGIQIHGEKSTEQLKPLHNRLVTCFQELKEKVEKHYGVITLVSTALLLLSRGPVGSLLAPVSERRGSVLSRAEEPFCDNRISRFNRKEWNISKSQVLTEREPDGAIGPPLPVKGDSKPPPPPPPKTRRSVVPSPDHAPQ
ncbi:UNVERIFIED_CONTAM: hypothetical protein FKN15_061068 [Acipenser sinensis]